MPACEFPPSTLAFHSKLGDIPVLIEYEVEEEAADAGSSADASSITLCCCLIGGHGASLLEGHSPFSSGQLARWRREAERHWREPGADAIEVADPALPDEWAAAAAEDAWLAQREHVHAACGRA